MKTKISTVKSLAIAMTLTALLVATSARAAAQSEKSLYERLGGVFAIAAVVDHFSDALVKNPIVGKNSKNLALGKWHRENLSRLPGLKFMRTLWVCEVTGGPFKFSPTKPGKTEWGLEEAQPNQRDSASDDANMQEVATKRLSEETDMNSVSNHYYRRARSLDWQRQLGSYQGAGRTFGEGSSRREISGQPDRRFGRLTSPFIAGS